jgi:hypothetical protein
MKKYVCKERIDEKRTRIKIICKEGRERVGIEHIGIAHNEDELKMFVALEREKVKDERQEEFKFREFEGEAESEVIHNKSYSKYLYDTISEVYDRLKLDKLEDETFRQIVIARIIKPASKLETVEILKRLSLEGVTNSGIWRCLGRIEKEGYRGEIEKRFIETAGIKRAALLLYDVTTLYFEIDKEDGYRKRGYSKERRLEPQIIVGLLVDKKGFPLSINSYEGNKAETKTIAPVLKAFKEENGIEEITVVADAGMLSADNLEKLEEGGYKFIVGSRNYKTPYEIEEYHYKKKKAIKDKKTFDTRQRLGESKKKWRVIYQYRKERADLDNRNIDKQLKKAQEQKESNAKIKKAKFLKIVKSKKEIDYEAVEAARQMAGIKGYVTNLKCNKKTVIDAYHNLFQVEKSFRMTKSDLRARPIFHQTRDSIEAHLTVCFAALGICRYIQERTKISIKKFISRLAELQTAIIEIAGKKHIARPRIDIETQRLVKLLK